MSILAGLPGLPAYPVDFKLVSPLNQGYIFYTHTHMCMCVNVHIHIVITLFLWRQCEHFWWLTFLTSFLNTSIVTKGPGIKPRASHMLGRSSAIELHCSLGLSFKAGVMKTFPNMARGPAEEREVFSSDPDTISCRQHSVYQMGPCWHIVVLILPVLEAMYRTCRKDFGYRQLPHTFFFHLS